MKLTQVITTVDSKEQAQKIASLLIDDRLAACVQIDGPVRSTYRWQGNIEQATEWRVTAKTLESHAAACTSRIKEVHTYDLPEIAHQTLEVSADYFQWVLQQISD